jgi:hypothetical protein
MKYTITHGCGHKEEHQVFGSSREREQEVKRLSEWPCSQCREESQRRKGQDAMIWAAENGLADLVGSEKQVLWASQIRRQRWQEIADMEREFYAVAEKAAAPEHADYIAKVKAAFQSLRKEYHAAWWIEHRDTPIRQLLKQFVK